MKISRIILLSLLVIIIAAILYGVYAYRGTVDVWKETYRETEEIRRNKNIPETGEDLISVLVLGIDREGLKGTDGMDDPGRSDAVLLLLVNTKTGKITALSIPRDLRVETRPERFEKLSHAYVYGPEVSMSVIENLFKIPVDYYIAFNYKTFADIVDLMGKIKIDADESIASKTEGIDEGPQRMSGETALFYVRFRNDDEGDFMRMKRQQQVIDAVISQAIKPHTIMNTGRFFDLAKKNIRHNIPPDFLHNRGRELISISPDKSEKLVLEIQNVEIDSLWYAIPKRKNFKEVQFKLQSEVENSKDQPDGG
ncbi:MAG: LCP family protein [Bacteroidota bacterium]